MTDVEAWQTAIQNSGLVGKAIRPFVSDNYWDLFQEGIIAAKKAAQKYNPELGELSTLITKYVKNKMSNIHQKEKNYQKLQKNNIDSSELEIIATDTSLNDPYVIASSKDFYEKVVQNLTPNQKFVVDEHVINQKSLRELSRERKCSNTNLQKHLHRTIKKVRKNIHI